MTTPVSIMLTDEQLTRLALIAEAREETVASTVQEAVTAEMRAKYGVPGS